MKKDEEEKKMKEEEEKKKATGTSDFSAWFSHYENSQVKT